VAVWLHRPHDDRCVSREGCEDFSKETGAALTCLPPIAAPLGCRPLRAGFKFGGFEARTRYDLINIKLTKYKRKGDPATMGSHLKLACRCVGSWMPPPCLSCTRPCVYPIPRACTSGSSIPFS